MQASACTKPAGLTQCPHPSLRILTLRNATITLDLCDLDTQHGKLSWVQDFNKGALHPIHEHKERSMLSYSARRLYNEQIEDVLEDAVVSWKRVYEGVKLAEILGIGQDQLPAGQPRF